MISPTRIGSQTATGAVMANFFRGWPLNSIAQIHSDRFSDFDYEACQEYYYIKSSTRKNRWIRMLGRFFGDLVGPGGLQRRKIDFKDILAWTHSFNPNIIYYRAVDRPSFYRWLPLKLSRTIRIPLITHIMDDWPARFEAKSNLVSRNIWIPRLRSHLQELFSYSRVNLSICDRMSEAFEIRYGVPFIPFHNGINVDEWQNVNKKVHSDSGEGLRIAYAGSLALDMQLWSLKDIAEVTSDLYKRGFKISMDIYAAEWWLPNYREHFDGVPGVRYAGFVPRSEFPRILMEVDLLVLPVNFDRESLDYVRYSMANKGPEYMASGTPILVYGPLKAATVEYAASEGWGYVVSERNKEKLERAILDLMSSVEKRLRLGQHARKLAFAKHDVTRVRQRFQTLLSRVANGDGSIV